MTPPLELSELQLAVMRVLWQKHKAAVAEVHEALEPERGLALTTVATVLTRLEKAGLVAHRAAGRHYLYRPLVSEEEVRRSMVSALADRLFEGDVAALVSHLVTAREIEPGDLARVKRLIEDKERKGGR
ncbi:MAG TPA: BlaI/MecI/CopY family transcriptional regulator [Gemmatimonadales bacterium]|nr:BlaI/MecI/CopY family transcriptional regulator [Gemmatimonadales bacterium]